METGADELAAHATNRTGAVQQRAAATKGKQHAMEVVRASAGARVVHAVGLARLVDETEWVGRADDGDRFEAERFTRDPFTGVGGHVARRRHGDHHHHHRGGYTDAHPV